MSKIFKPKIVIAMLWLATAVLVAFGASKLGSIAEAKYERTRERPDPVSKLLEQGRYDEAIQVRLDENKEGVRDADTFDGIALIYLERAKKDLADRQMWANDTSVYFDKATAAAPKNPFILESAMDGYNRLGDYKDNGCPEYQKAIGFGEAALALLQGDTITVDGSARPYPTQMIKEGIEPPLKRIRAKVEAWCMKP